METQKETPKSPVPKSSMKDTRDNMFVNAKSMILSSIGRLPTALVVVLLGSMAMAAIAGMAMQWTKPPANATEFLPLRLEASENALPIDTKKLQGTWVYQTSNYAMSFTIIGDRYEWITVFADVPEAQFYSRGNYRIEGDVLILGIRPDLGTPMDPQKPWMKYMPMAMKNVNINLQMSGKQIVWNVPQSEQRRIIAQSGQIFVGHEDGIFEWTRQ